jgi:two-component sensor histidine kinase
VIFVCLASGRPTGARPDRSRIAVCALPITFLFRPLRRDKPWLGIFAACVLIIAAGTVRWSLGDLSEGFGPMMLLPAILLSGVLGGVRVGLVAAVVCVLVAWTWFFPPYGSFRLEFRAIVTMVVFVITAAFELYVVATLNRTMEDLASARERSHTMFRELQHRVANNLQFVAGLLRIGQRNAEGAGARALADARGRLELMSRVHRRLHDPGAVDLPVGRYLDELCRDLIAASDKTFVRLAVDAKPVVLDLESLMSVSLIVAELVTNSLKHAFAGRDHGEIAIGLGASGRTATLTVVDDGPGLPPDFGRAGSGSLGQGIIQSLAVQLHGTLTFESGRGATARLTFPV